MKNELLLSYTYERYDVPVVFGVWVIKSESLHEKMCKCLTIKWNWEHISFEREVVNLSWFITNCVCPFITNKEFNWFMKCFWNHTFLNLHKQIASSNSISGDDQEFWNSFQMMITMLHPLCVTFLKFCAYTEKPNLKYSGNLCVLDFTLPLINKARIF